MTNYTTLGEVFNVFNGHTGVMKNNANTASEWYNERKEHYRTLADGVLEGDENMNDDEWGIACQKYAILRGMYWYNTHIITRLNDSIQSVSDTVNRLGVVMLSNKELKLYIDLPIKLF